MGTRIRSEVSKQKAYWLPKHRHLELVHFCLQYPDWQTKLNSLDGYSRISGSVTNAVDKSGEISKPVERVVEERLELQAKIDLVNETLKEAAFDMYRYLLEGVTKGIGYERLNAPCCKEVYYIMYRRFFWLLDKARK